MKKEYLFLGIDTSCYTTSVAICDENKNIIFNSRNMLPVKAGGLGLRQSEAVFAHIKNLNSIFKETNISDFGTIRKICVSSTPRKVEGSYMPVFLAGEAFASSIASATGAEIEYSAHQNGHLFAALIGNSINGSFAAIHLSGGTSEILKASASGNDYDISIIGSTLDISAGKLIDRIGVKLGFEFPCGKYVEQLAKKGKDIINFKTSVKDTDFNFSGVETLAMKAIDNSVFDNADVALSVQHAIVKTLSKAVINACKKHNLKNAVFFGGVICNEYIKENIDNILKKENINCIFAQKEFSGDNACGLAVHACESYKNNNEQ